MPLYKVGTLIGPEGSAHTEYVQADYFTEAIEGLNFYERGEGEGKERTDTRVGAWVKGTYSYVYKVNLESLKTTGEEISE